MKFELNFEKTPLAKLYFAFFANIICDCLVSNVNECVSRSRDKLIEIRKSRSSSLELVDEKGGAELQQSVEEGGAGWVAAVATHAQHLAHTHPNIRG